MRYFISITATLLFFMAATEDALSNTSVCKQPKGVVLQVLGSGGPIADDGRASAGYLVWVDGRSRFMIDSGGGTFLRFGEAGARFEDLSHIAISHFHTDHSIDLAALLKSGYFSERSHSLSISGPAGGEPYPSLDKYLESMLGVETGAYAYLAGYLDGSTGLVKLDTRVVDPGLQNVSKVYSNQKNKSKVLAIGVPHGSVPALAYRVKIGAKSIVFSGDQNGSSDAFLTFAQGADVLVMHMPVHEDISGVGRKLHAPPSIIGEIATKTGAGKLVLSHFMARSLRNFEHNLDTIRIRYAGPVVSANDLECISF